MKTSSDTRSLAEGGGDATENVCARACARACDVAGAREDDLEDWTSRRGSNHGALLVRPAVSLSQGGEAGIAHGGAHVPYTAQPQHLSFESQEPYRPKISSSRLAYSLSFVAGVVNIKIIDDHLWKVIT